ncbi:hypothetical protein GCM10012290_05270 [Halolactibacillus alkaliphilus]|uniref:YibE/F n=1 Tax=Halolactibacillus alkaliphilus TaxID=442899 RepID=A0A511WXJ3_9BACI|nr:YibE/F family protein [Halolactibacillus alkaliphilus]GEN55839.1 hypothetical protein HAL01_03030 [Halolactibacillus alkaliphilus]GGN65992.1 hypothetical protein GCM10012290_05270 [Halolactibacillus alkaliphilus]SFO66566.1 YibE/F-like protein [Halolactibacillus alkaliphilus]
MTTISLLAIILFILMSVIGGKKGLLSFTVMLIHVSVIIVAVLIMTDPAASPIIITLLASVVISYATLFLINGKNEKTKISFLATIATMMVLIAMIHFFVLWTRVGGFSTEEVEELAIYSFYFGVNFTEVITSVIILSTIGAVTDEAISVVSPMYELYRHNQNQSKKELFMSGMRVGMDLLSTSANTLFFAFFGSYLALLVRFFDMGYQISEVLNAKVFVQEIVTILLSGVGIVLVVPVTAYLTAYRLTSTRSKSDTSSYHLVRRIFK